MIKSGELSQQTATSSAISNDEKNKQWAVVIMFLYCEKNVKSCEVKDFVSNKWISFDEKK